MNEVTLCIKCGVLAGQRGLGSSKYCGDGSDKDNEHRFQKVSIPEVVIHWNNGQVIVCGKDGQQIFELQGHYSDVRDKILAASDSKTLFYNGTWIPRNLSEPIPKDQW